MGITELTLNSNAGSIEQNLCAAAGSSQSTGCDRRAPDSGHKHLEFQIRESLLLAKNLVIRF